MEFHTHHPSSSPSSSSSLNPSSSLPSSSTSFGIWVDRVGNICSSVISAALGNLVSAFFIFIFTMFGSLLGGMAGACIGQETESGFFRGAVVGAISGAVFSIEAFEYSLVVWKSDDSEILYLFYLIDVIVSLLSGRLVRDRICPVLLNALTNQMDSIVSTETSFEEAFDIFETCGLKGLSEDSVDKIPKIEITAKNNVDAYGDRISCSVCLQDLQLRETARCLPHCHHMFHLSCIDKWLVKQGNCPLCRRVIVPKTVTY